MPSKKIKSFAKINIHLNILKKLNSGYHKLETLVMFCNLHDLIYINKNKKVSTSNPIKSKKSI